MQPIVTYVVHSKISEMHTFDIGSYILHQLNYIVNADSVFISITFLFHHFFDDRILHNNQKNMIHKEINSIFIISDLWYQFIIAITF